MYYQYGGKAIFSIYQVAKYLAKYRNRKAYHSAFSEQDWLVKQYCYHMPHLIVIKAKHTLEVRFPACDD